MPCRRLLWMPIGEARLKSSTFLHGQSARKKVTYEVRDASGVGKRPSCMVRRIAGQLSEFSLPRIFHGPQGPSQIACGQYRSVP